MMVKIIAIDKDGKDEGVPKRVNVDTWTRMLRFGKTLRWREIIEIKEVKFKEKKDGRKKRSVIGNAVEKAE